MEFGAKRKFPSIVLPRAYEGALVLAGSTSDDRPVTLFQARKWGKLFWSAVPNLPAAAIRAIARSAGVPVTSNENQAVYAGYGCIGVHANCEKTVRVKLPRPGACREMFGGREWPAATSEVEFELKAGETRLLRCSR